MTLPQKVYAIARNFFFYNIFAPYTEFVIHDDRPIERFKGPC